MKKLFLLVVFLCVGALATSQVTNEGEPLSWSLQSLNKDNISPVKMKPFDLDKIKAEDAINDTKRDIPFRFGHELKVNLGLENSGVWNELPNGDRIWRINIISEGATSLNFVFSNYEVPRGAKIYLYSNDRKDLLGAYTNIFNRPDKLLGTWMVAGDNVWIEYYEPARVKGQGDLTIAKVIHGYRSVTDAMVREKALNTSGDCNQDVDCPVGNDFDALKDQLKKSVAFVILNGFVCSGNLINNTSNDRAPYFLTANHCQSGSESTWAFRFNWISPNPSCATTANSTDATVNQTTSGATVLAANTESDFKLLNLDGGLDESWDLEWAGWDRTGDVPSFTVGIHHPDGDIMKVCRDNNVPTKEETPFNGNPQTKIWFIEDWDLGVTEGGSSGSAIFDPNGRIIGQLAGGAAACNGTNDNNQFDFYGRFDVSWDFGTTDATRLSNWLDPSNTERTTLDMLSVEGTTNPPVTGNAIVVSFVPSTALVSISKGNNDPIEFKIYDISGGFIGSGALTGTVSQIDMSDRSSGMYFIKIRNMTNGESLTRKVVINRNL
ncbi:T9SS type A sorting domain-containing protein [Aquimarina spongiae]|uniref:Por secretion system C-terminal sorting domain-containing protein n=1 Tax=Aquimarina spongiae TaxID=570521 RepID=A0A1M6IU05_9FLAO|nr:T9SS type A sorting domain-containing protein [Aquimarina spongiae]SHJ37960.1 Por secretion system C-terminal sorting domain-containing protein [Aquimarina spongiae]